MYRFLTTLTVIAVFLSGCTTSPTGRQQVLLMPAAQLDQMGAEAYNQMKQELPISRDARKVRYVQCITDALTAQVDSQYKWEVTLFDDDSANAFALPGGKMGVHTGLLNVAENQHQLSAVIGHEIAHVLAQHANERMSIQYATRSSMDLLGAIVGQDTATKQTIFGVLGVGSQFGIAMPFSRRHEAEADIMGLEIMARAGFDPNESVTLWQNMSRASGGSPPEFLSTHPSHSTRINGLRANIPRVMPDYERAVSSGRTPDCRV